MNLNRYTEKANERMQAAQLLAERSHHPQIEPEHLLLTLVEQPDGVVPSVLRRLGVEPVRMLEEGRRLLGRQPQAHGGAEADPSPRLRAVASVAESEAERMKDEYVSTEHLLLALTLEGNRAASAQLLSRYGVTTERVFEALAHRKPLVLVVDDLQWAEPTFIDLVEHIARRTRDAPMLMLVVARPDPRWPAGHRPAPGGQVSGAGAIRVRPDRAGRSGQARPRDRP